MNGGRMPVTGESRNYTDLLVLDFDRTLFDTGQFVRDTERVLAGRSADGNEPSDKLAVLQHFVDPNPRLQHAVAHARHLLPHRSYLFPEAAAFLKSLPPHIKPVVMTFADIESYQHWKLGFAPELRDLPLHVTTVNKGILLAGGIHRQEGGICVRLPHVRGLFRRVWLVDDNPWAFEPLDPATTPIRMVYLDRAGERYAGQRVGEHVTRISQLADWLPLARA